MFHPYRKEFGPLCRKRCQTWELHLREEHHIQPTTRLDIEVFLRAHEGNPNNQRTLETYSAHYITNPNYELIEGKPLKMTVHLHCLVSKDPTLINPDLRENSKSFKSTACSWWPTQRHPRLLGHPPPFQPVSRCLGSFHFPYRVDWIWELWHCEESF